MRLTKEDILRKAEEWRIEFVRLQFMDILGIVKNVTVPVRELEKALDNKIMFDGSSVEGFTRIQESDMYLHPDYDTLVTIPWQEVHRTARLICDVYTPDGQPFAGDPRYVLKRAVGEAAKLGLTMMTGPEVEFFLFKTDADGRPTTVTHDQGSYFDLAPVDRGKQARRDVVLALEQMGFEVEASHHEVAPGQHEINLRYADALTAADLVATCKIVTREAAQRHGLHATFMPKPLFGVNGSGMHTHISLLQDGRNAFYDPDGQYELSQAAFHFIGGLMKHARAMTAITNPLVNSYKRLVPGYEAPVYITWSLANRSALVRIPAVRGDATRLELRHPDPSCNPYLAFALMLRAGLDGLVNRIEPPLATFKNVYIMTPEERTAESITSLPGDIYEAVQELREDEVMVDA
ncbi:MAG: type I glutamate--ammonia ligase, partial [Bacillota bacterium]